MESNRSDDDAAAMPRTAMLGLQDSASGALPSLRKTAPTSGYTEKQVRKPPLRVMLAAGEASLRDAVAETLRDEYTLEMRIDAPDANEAAVALLLRHPDLVVCDVALPGHAQRGFRVVTEALMLGVPVLLLCGSVQPVLGKRLAQLGVAWVPKGATPNVFFDGVDLALRGREEHIGLQTSAE
jgi:hypothetical protein